MGKRIVVIGAGFGGMSAAAYLAQAGHQVTVVEKNDQPGGRAYTVTQDGYTWELGPSWYMMPDVFEEFFADFGKRVGDYYELRRLNPSYRVFDNQQDSLDVRDAAATIKLFDHISPGAGQGLAKLLRKTAAEYTAVRSGILTTDWLQWRQAFNPKVLTFLLNPEMVRSYDSRVSTYVQTDRLKRILEFMTVFMGGSPGNIPGMYTLLAHVDMGLKIWYPMGGFSAVARSFEALGVSLGVEYVYNAPVQEIMIEHGRTVGIKLEDGQVLACDVVVANADYHHVQTALLPTQAADISAGAWRRKVLSPSGLMVSLGVSKQLPELQHHNLFFDTDWGAHFKAVFTDKQWSPSPLFYLCAPAKTDPSVAPGGHENLFVLAPQAVGVEPTQQQLDDTVGRIIDRIEQRAGAPFKNAIVARDIRTQKYFTDAFNAYQGNAFGLAHTLRQSALFRPRLKSRKVQGLYFVGQYTNPGTGVPMVVLSGKTVAGVVHTHES